MIARFSRDHCNIYLFFVDCFDCVTGTFSFFTRFALKYQKLLIHTSVTIKPSHYHFKHPNYSIRRTLICQKLTHTFTSLLGPSKLLSILYYIYLKLLKITPISRDLVTNSLRYLFVSKWTLHSLRKMNDNLYEVFSYDNFN